MIDELTQDNHVPETIIQQSIRRNAPTSRKQDYKWNTTEIIRKDIRQEFLVDSKDAMEIPETKLSLETSARSKIDRTLVDCLKYCKVISFSHLTEDYDADYLVQELPSIAVLVRGVWIVKSELLYPETLAHVRNHLLHLFHQNETVKRSQLAELYQLDAASMFNMFSEIASKHSSGWSLKHASDKVFTSKYAGIVKEQEQLIMEMVSFV